MLLYTPYVCANASVPAKVSFNGVIFGDLKNKINLKKKKKTKQFLP